MNEYYTEVGGKLSKRMEDECKANSFFDVLNTNKFSFVFVTEKVEETVVKGIPMDKQGAQSFLESQNKTFIRPL